MDEITPELVERMCRVLVEHGWIALEWDSRHDGECPTCGRVRNSDGDGGENVRAEVRAMLKEAWANVG